MVYYISEIIASILECLFITRFCNRFLRFKSDKYKILKSTLLFSFLLSDDILLAQRENFETISIIILLTVIFIYSLIFLKANLSQKLLVSILPAITILPVNLIVLQVFSLTSGVSLNELTSSESTVRIMILFFTKSIQFFMFDRILKIKDKDAVSLEGSEWIIQLLCFGASFFISENLWIISIRFDETAPEFTLIYLLIIMLNILLYGILVKLQRKHIAESEYKLLQQHLTAQKELLAESEKRYVEMRRFKHDIKHHLTAISAALKQKKYDEAQKYADNILEHSVPLFSYPVNTGSDIIDAVICSKLSECAENNIKTKCSIDTNLASFDETDLSILLSNILDNAVNAAKICDEPFIELKIMNRKSYLGVIVKNTIQSSVLKTNPNLTNLNSDKDNHGYGITSIRNIARKYNGETRFYEKGDFFTAEAWLLDKNVPFTHLDCRSGKTIDF